MTRRVAVTFLVIGVWMACDNSTGPTETTDERPLYYLKAPTNNGDNQSDTVLGTLDLPFRVLVRRGSDPAPGITVLWEFEGDTLFGMPGFTRTSLTDEHGIATAPFLLTLGRVAQMYAVRARVDSVFVPSPILVFTDLPCASALCFYAIARPGQPRQLRYVSGNGQIGVVGTSLDSSYVVQTTDAYGNGSPGVTIDWTVTAGGGTIAPTQTTTAGPLGLASATLTLGPFDATQTVRARAAALPGAPQVSFTATGFSAAPVASVQVTPESASVQLDRTTQLSAELRDADGRLVIRRAIAWTSVDPAIAFVDTIGLVRGAGVGTTFVVAESEDVRDSAFITVTPGPPPVVFASIVAGLSHSCGVRSDGAAYCWGDNTYGQLGDSTRISRRNPVAVRGGHLFTALVTGADHTCGLTNTGAAYCWGRGGDGQLGHGQVMSSNMPVAVANGLTFATLGSGSYHTCGVTSVGKAYCWGWNAYGQLGDGRLSSAAIPVAVAGSLTFTNIGTGRGSFFNVHTCGVTDTGAGYCWGDNEYGQLGRDSIAFSAVPVEVRGGLSFVTIGTGWIHSCGLTDVGVVQCWGANYFGQLGDNPDVCDPPNCTRATPGPVLGSAGITNMASGMSHICQLSGSGAASCWGSNDAGQLGAGASAVRGYVPVAVFGGLTFSGLAAGGAHTCALNSAGVAYCWGSNGSGQLGDGSTTSSSIPVRVVSGP